MSKITAPALTFSIIIPNYNYARYLKTAVDSALAQDHPRFEVIVVDDASTDDSLRVLDQFGERVRMIAKPENRGHADAFNSGFAVASGDIVLFLDSDDFLHPQALSAITAAWRDGAAMYHWRLDVVDSDGNVIDLYPPPEIRLHSGDVRPLLARTGRYSTSVTTGMAFSREALAHVMPIDRAKFSRSGDGYLAAVVPFYGEVVEVPGVHGAYRQHGGNHSQFAQDLAMRSRWRLEHDAFRLEAMSRHARLTGVTMNDEPLLNDLQHLQERAACLLIDPASHPFQGDAKSHLALRGLIASVKSPYGGSYKAYLSLSWLAILLLPRFAARSVLSWRLSAASRPRWIDRMLKLLRRARLPLS